MNPPENQEPPVPQIDPYAQAPQASQPLQPQPEPLQSQVESQPVQPQYQALTQSQPVQNTQPSADIQSRHQQSQEQYPDIHLAESECVIAEVHRHPIGLFLPFATTIILIGVVIAFLVDYHSIASYLNLTGALASVWTMLLPGLLAIALLLLVMYVISYIYGRNFFLLTNERVIENTQYGLLSHREQSVSLGTVGEASYEQTGALQYMFNYGSVRLSTIGDVADEDTYAFSYVRDPKAQQAVISDAIENFKNNRSNL